jgi:hypothetical protein
MDRRIWVKELRKKVKVEILKLQKPKELKQFIVIDLQEDTHRQIMNSGWKRSRRKQAGEVETFEGQSPEVD